MRDQSCANVDSVYSVRVSDTKLTWDNGQYRTCRQLAPDKIYNLPRTDGSVQFLNIKALYKCQPF